MAMAIGEYVTASEAMELLQTNRKKLAALIKKGELHTTADPMDARVKLIKRAEVEALMRRSRKFAE